MTRTTRTKGKTDTLWRRHSPRGFDRIGTLIGAAAKQANEAYELLRSADRLLSRFDPYREVFPLGHVLTWRDGRGPARGELGLGCDDDGKFGIVRRVSRPPPDGEGRFFRDADGAVRFEPAEVVLASWANLDAKAYDRLAWLLPAFFGDLAACLDMEVGSGADCLKRAKSAVHRLGEVLKR